MILKTVAMLSLDPVMNIWMNWSASPQKMMTASSTFHPKSWLLQDQKRTPCVYNLNINSMVKTTRKMDSKVSQIAWCGKSVSRPITMELVAMMVLMTRLNSLLSMTCSKADPPCSFSPSREPRSMRPTWLSRVAEWANGSAGPSSSSTSKGSCVGNDV